jgi:phage-related baseplate assembly protein
MVETFYDYLKGLPLPSVLEELSYEEVLAEVKARFVNFSPDYELFLESDPAMKQLEYHAYSEFVLRLRFNEVIKSTLALFATGSALDQVVAGNGTRRLVIQEENLNAVPPVPLIMETDENLLKRFLINASGVSTAGPTDRYKSLALNSSPQVKDANVYSDEAAVVNISILSTVGNGIPAGPLLATVTAAVTDEEKKVLTDTVNVIAASKIDFSVVATVYLNPATQQSVYDNLAAFFTTQYNNQKSLGKAITKAWIYKTLMVEGVDNVVLTTPSSDVAITQNQFGNLTGITLTQG